MAWVALAWVAALVLMIAAWLEPSPTGMGTHQQLGLLPCGMLFFWQIPCPGCGLTTAFAHLVRGEWQTALQLNTLALPLFLATCASVPFGLVAAWRAWSWRGVLQSPYVSRLILLLVGVRMLTWGVERLLDGVWRS